MEPNKTSLGLWFFFKSKQWKDLLTRWVCSVSCNFLCIFLSALLSLWSTLAELFGSSLWDWSTLSCFGCQRLCGIVFRTRTRGGKLCKAQNPHRCLAADSSLPPSSGPAALWEALVPRSAGPWGQPVFRSPPLPSRAFVPRWPLLQGAGAPREGAAEQRQWLEPGRGSAAGPRCSLRPGRAGSVRERAERGGSGCQRREVGTERSGAAGAGDASAAASAALPREGAPGAGWLRCHGGGSQSAELCSRVWNCFERKGRCRVLAIEGGKPGRRRLPWASGKGCRTAGQMCEGWRPRGDSLWLAGSFRWCSKVDSWVISE